MTLNKNVYIYIYIYIYEEYRFLTNKTKIQKLNTQKQITKQNKKLVCF